MLYYGGFTMFIGQGEKQAITFITPAGEELPVMRLPDNFSDLRYDTMYPIGDHLYRYRGQLGVANRQHKSEPGTILKIGDVYTVVTFDDATDAEKNIYHVKNTIIETDETDDLDVLLSQYKTNYLLKNNLVVDNKKKLMNTGEYYIPELKENDDALTRIMKLMIIHVGVILNNHRGKFDKEYSLDNMRSAINCATVNMTITKFLAWCDLLNLEWEFRLEDNGNDFKNPLLEPIVISSKEPLWIECGDSEPNIFKVPLTEGEDPLKRIIKVCIIKKHMVLADYKDKGSTPHLLNNMRSALKRGSRMMFPYFVYWCEILGVNYILRLINPEDGHVEEADVNYKSSDYINTQSSDDE